MRLPEGRRYLLNTSECLSTSRCRTALPMTTGTPAMRILLLEGQLPLLLLLSSLCQPTWSYQVETKIDFDLAPGSFDDRYQGCSKQVMEKLNQGDYFTNELKSRKGYSNSWHRAHLTWLSQAKTLPKDMTTAHAVAIVLYTLNSNISSDFINATRSAGRSTWQYNHSFHFKYLHYYLTSAIQLLRQEIARKNGTRCYKAYHGAEDAYFKAHPGAVIRFGQFLSASLLREKTQTFGNQTVFAISTCLGVPVEDFSLRKEILVPPYELFEVVNISNHPRGSWLELQSAGNLSTYNCQLLKGTSALN
ncbi:PREDICTED: ecto-ADP-ribosyltransferase 4 [Elephantulus edwardii]|uniref:ecto-ADP-ribosyltransferase 4 n=1 Tax=Elephantulus edwardii TaxID=28737 RepID=UPI0003F0EAD7|nr:PREDICTED: ecto-ADP-ribosyltransferase 4 [Elephantulus edwardii]